MFNDFQITDILFAIIFLGIFFLCYLKIKIFYNKKEITSTLTHENFVHIFSGSGTKFIAFNIESNEFKFGDFYTKEISHLHVNDITNFEWKWTTKGAQKITNKFLFHISKLEHYMHEIFYSDSERLAEKDWARIHAVFENFNTAPVDLTAPVTSTTDHYDFFISHASEDKEAVVRPLVDALHRKGFTVWYDEFSLKVGDSLRESIDYGLKNSKFGIVILSESFFIKRWPEYELNSLNNKSISGENVILPIWHEVNQESVSRYSLSLGEKVALSTNHYSPDMLATEFAKVITD